MKRALVLSLAVVLGLTFAGFAQGELSGEWDTSLIINPTVPTLSLFFNFNTEIDVLYTVGGWSFGSYSYIDDLGWGQQYFTAAGSFGAFSIDTKLEFAPSGGYFLGWIVDTSFIFGSVDIGLEFILVPSDVQLTLTAAATTGVVDIDISLVLGGVDTNWTNYCLGLWYYDPSGDLACDFDFGGIQVDIDFPFCCADIHADIDFDCNGFVKACFETKGIVVPNIPWLTLEAEICFMTDSKTIDIHPTIDYGTDICFDLYFETVQSGGGLVYGTTDLSDIGTLLNIQFVGIGLECEIGGVSFSGISYWGSGIYQGFCYGYTKPGLLGYGTPTGDRSGVWEAYRIATTEDGCCGPFDFDLTFRFSGASAFLFDISNIIANFSYELGPNFTFDMGFTYSVGAPGLALLSIGFEVTW
jgi:hypothetical protein